MLQLRNAADRGHSRHGWLDSHHTFSFASYYDSALVGYGPLRVINEDRVQPGRGFGTHPHADMEIITYVLDGALEHKDSMGNGSVIRPGDVQHMSAGKGVRHSEFNASQEVPVHFLQIWIQPNRRGGTPRYGQEHFPIEQRRNALRLVASGDGRQGSIPIEQDANMYASVLEPGHTLSHEVTPGRGAWVHVARGTLRTREHTLGPGDALSTNDPGLLQFEAPPENEVEFLVFDLPIKNDEETNA